MKPFFEEYGFIILACVVVISLIALVTILGSDSGPIMTSLTEIIESWKTSVVSKIQ